MRQIEVIEQIGSMRLIRMHDMAFDLEELKGDCYSPAAHPDMLPDQLRAEERKFERRVEQDGVWGYEVQTWNPGIGEGWEHVDSIWGFVGEDFEGSGHDAHLRSLLNSAI